MNFETVLIIGKKNDKSFDNEIAKVRQVRHQEFKNIHNLHDKIKTFFRLIRLLNIN